MEELVEQGPAMRRPLNRRKGSVSKTLIYMLRNLREKIEEYKEVQRGGDVVVGRGYHMHASHHKILCPLRP